MFWNRKNEKENETTMEKYPAPGEGLISEKEADPETDIQAEEMNPEDVTFPGNGDTDANLNPETSLRDSEPQSEEQEISAEVPAGDIPSFGGADAEDGVRPSDSSDLPEIDEVWKSAVAGKEAKQAEESELSGPEPEGKEAEGKEKGFWKKLKGKNSLSKDEIAAREKAAEEKAALKEKKKRKIRVIFIGTLVGILVLIGAYFGINYAIAQSKLRAVGIDSESCLGMDYMELKETLESSGFTNIHTLAIEDLEYEDLKQEGQVFFTAVDDAVVFEAEEKYPNDSDVIILYHAARTVQSPYSADTCTGVDAEAIAAAFEEAGFVNVSVAEDADLVFGIFHKEGDIESIVIDGADAADGASYRVDAEVIITYHAFSK